MDKFSFEAFKQRLQITKAQAADINSILTTEPTSLSTDQVTSTIEHKEKKKKSVSFRVDTSTTLSSSFLPPPITLSNEQLLKANSAISSAEGYQGNEIRGNVLHLNFNNPQNADNIRQQLTALGVKPIEVENDSTTRSVVILKRLLPEQAQQLNSLLTTPLMPASQVVVPIRLES